MENNSAIKFFKPLKDYWDNLDKGKKIAYCSLAAVFLVIVIASALLLNNKDYVVLYSGLETKEAGEIYNKLVEKGVEVQSQGTGTLLVPKKQEASLRMELSAEGYPASGLNYDLFKNSTGFGTTDYEKQKYMQFQLQDRLQNSIKSLDTIEDAIVTLYIPETTSFVLKADKQSASASVILQVKNGAKLTSSQINGIVGLVSKSVPGLLEDQILIIDSQGNTLNKMTSDDTAVASTQLELENNISDKYKDQIQDMLEPVFGAGKVIAGVRVSLDFDKKTTESTKYEPLEGSSEGIPVSSNQVTERATGGQTAGVAGQDANGGAASYPEVNTDSGSYEKTEKTVNYEMNQIKELLQKSEGNINDISVSIILDANNLQPGADEKVKTIVAGATGIAPEKVVVQTMNFNGSSSNDINNIFENVNENNKYIQKQAFIRNAIFFGALALLMLIIALFMVNIKKNKSKKAQELDVLVNDIINEKSGSKSILEDEDFEFSLKKSDQRKLIEKNIDRSPEFIAQLLRNWLDEYGG